jgi:hypothetical protein
MPRITIRQLMIAVACFGLIFAVVRWLSPSIGVSGATYVLALPLACMGLFGTGRIADKRGYIAGAALAYLALTMVLLWSGLNVLVVLYILLCGRF